MEFSLRGICHALSVSASGYYCWRHRKPSARSTENARLSGQIKELHAQSRMTYGSPKVYRKLRQQGEVVNHKRVERLMREHGLRARRARKFKRTTHSRHHLPVAEKLLDRHFQVARPDAVWVSDITYVWTAEGWLYLAVFLDLYSRLVVGWAVSDQLTSKFVEEAFLLGQHRRGQAVSPLVHSDRGSQYASASFRERLKVWSCQQSMSRKGNCWDNAVAESFFGNLKCEMVDGEQFVTRQEAKDRLFDYIEVFYNRARIHSAAGYLAPAEYEARFEQVA
jgi:putative transposase